MEGFALEVLVGQQGGIAVDDELGVLQTDKGNKQANAHADSGFQRQGDGVEDGLAHIGQGQHDEDDAFNKDGQQSHLPAVAHGEHNGVGKVGVQAHAGCQCKGVVCQERHEHGADKCCQRSGDQNCLCIHTGCRQNVGVDRKNVSHRHKGRDTGHDFGFYIRVVLFQVEEFFHDVPPFSKRYFRGTPKATAQRDFLAGMPAAPQVSANDATFSF